jgi:signal transduction histidine kinase
VAYRNAQTGEITLYNYGLTLRGADSSVVMDISDLGELPGASLQDAGRVSGLPATPRGRIQMPLLALKQLVATAEAHDGLPEEDPRVGMEVGVVDDRVVIGLRRAVGIPFAAGLVLLAVLLLAVLYLVRQNRISRRSVAILAQGQRAAIASREAERVRIAREIHDGPVQRIAALALTVGSDLQSPTAGDELRELTRELRGMADGLRPPSLERFGIGAAIEALAARVEEEHPEVTVLPQIDDEFMEERLLNPEDEVNLYRITQETVNNALEHSGGTIIVVRIERESARQGGGLVLEVIDDGEGFTWPSDLGVLREKGHFGLVGIAERAELLSAKITVSDGVTGGMHFKLRIPKSRVGAAEHV